MLGSKSSPDFNMACMVTANLRAKAVTPPPMACSADVSGLIGPYGSDDQITLKRRPQRNLNWFLGSNPWIAVPAAAQRDKLMTSVKPIRTYINSFACLFASFAVLATANDAMAATDGTLGATSTGAININASVANRVRLTGLTDVSLLNQDAGTAASNTQNICVWSNTATKGYSISATGNGTAGAFTLATTGGLSVVYSVEWEDTSGASTGTSLTAGAASNGYTSSATHQSCSVGPSNSASLIVGLDTTALSSMQAGVTYTGVLTLLVSPE